MEHIIQFGVNIDDEAIIRQATNMASNAIVNLYRKEVDEYSRRMRTDQIYRDEVKALIEENKEYIIDKAIKQLVLNLSKTKVVKDAVTNVITGENND